MKPLMTLQGAAEAMNSTAVLLSAKRSSAPEQLLGEGKRHRQQHLRCHEDRRKQSMSRQAEHTRAVNNAIYCFHTDITGNANQSMQHSSPVEDDAVVVAVLGVGGEVLHRLGALHLKR